MQNVIVIGSGCDTNLTRVKSALFKSCGVLCLALILFIQSCALFQGETPGVVQAQTAGVISATRIAVGLVGQEDTLNAYIAVCHNFLAGLASDIQKGIAVLPTPDVIHQDLINLAGKFGNPTWALNMAGNLWITYQRFYNSINVNSPQVLAYVNAFAIATI